MGEGQFSFISDADWAYACTVATKTQDHVQRNLLEILAAVVGRALPSFPRPAVTPGSPQKPAS